MEQPTDEQILEEKKVLRLDTIEELLPEDILWLEKALAVDYRGWRTEHILDDFAEGKRQLWRLKTGIAATTIIDYPKVRELTITHMAGEGIISILPNINEEIGKYAQARFCNSFNVIAWEKGLQRVYAKFGREKGISFVREV